MEVVNCRSCGRLFNYISGYQICPDCKKRIEEKFEVVKQYLRDHPDATMKDVVEDNDVTRRQVEIWIREERISFSSEVGSEIGCERCKKPIRSGKYCSRCRDIMTNTLNGFYREEQKEKMKGSSNGKMRFLE